MAAPNDYFVDPAINANGGTGVAADPWTRVGGIDVVQNGINQIVAGPLRDPVNGDRINVVSDQAPGVTTTTDDTITAVLNLAAYGAPAADAPLIVRGCSRDPTTGLPVAGNGGIGGMDGAAGGWSTYDGNAGATDYVHFIDMHLHNTAAANVMRMRDYSSAINCQLDTSTAYALLVNNYCDVLNCYLHSTTNSPLIVATYCLAFGNYIESPSGAGQSSIFINGTSSSAERNIIVLDDVGAYGIRFSGHANRAIGNSILSTVANTQSGIYYDAVGLSTSVVLNNLIEGFSGAGGAGIDFFNSTQHVHAYANNSFYDNLEDVAALTDCDKNYDEDNDLIMAASPFMKEGAMTFANRFNYFKAAIPVRGRAFPTGCQSDRGAMQVRLAVERTIPETCIVTIPERTVLDPL